MRKKQAYQIEGNSEDLTFKLGRRDDSSPHHWREVSGKLPVPAQKQIFIFPGSGANSARAANGMCKILEQMLGADLAKQCEIYSLYWPNSRVYQAATAARTQQFFDACVVPLVSTQDGEGNLRRISVKEAASNLRKVVFVTHCYGGYVTEALDRELRQLLKTLDYSEKEQKYIQKQLVVVHHNSVNANIGRKEVRSTNLYRSSKADEENVADDFRLGTIQHYIQSEQLADDEVLYVPVSENERFFLANKIVVNNGEEHNGGYWVDSPQKTPAGQQEERLFQAVFREVVRSSEPVESPEQFVRAAVLKDGALKEDFSQALNFGKEYGDALRQERDSMQQGYTLAKEQIENGVLKSGDVTYLSENVLFMLDENDDFLLDTALARQDYVLAGALYRAMNKWVPVAGKREYVFYKSANHQHFSNTKKYYAQAALDASNAEFFKICAEGQVEMEKLDYTHANDEMILMVAELYVPRPVSDVWYDKINHFKPLVYMVARCEKMAQTKDVKRVRAQIERKIFSDYTHGAAAGSLRREIQSFCSQFGAAELMAKTQKNWKSVEPIVSTDVMKRETIKLR